MPNAKSHTVAYSPLDAIVVRRSKSMFEDDLARQSANITDAVRGARVLVVGGAGTIGASCVRLLARFQPATLHVVDQSENYLAELIRDLRGAPPAELPHDLRTFAIDYGGGA